LIEFGSRKWNKNVKLGFKSNEEKTGRDPNRNGTSQRISLATSIGFARGKLLIRMYSI
jgi:hypothetical protein